MYTDVEWMKKLIGALIGAAVAIPSIAGGFRVLYDFVTYAGNYKKTQLLDKIQKPESNFLLSG